MAGDVSNYSNSLGILHDDVGKAILGRDVNADLQ
jgi:hypothetical protein